jgi:hypothetical protein
VTAVEREEAAEEALPRQEKRERDGMAAQQTMSALEEAAANATVMDLLMAVTVAMRGWQGTTTATRQPANRQRTTTSRRTTKSARRPQRSCSFSSPSAPR